jgi:hypothetical protein
MACLLGRCIHHDALKLSLRALGHHEYAAATEQWCPTKWQRERMHEWRQRSQVTTSNYCRSQNMGIRRGNRRRHPYTCAESIYNERHVGVTARIWACNGSNFYRFKSGDSVVKRTIVYCVQTGAKFCNSSKHRLRFSVVDAHHDECALRLRHRVHCRLRGFVECLLAQSALPSISIPLMSDEYRRGRQTHASGAPPTQPPPLQILA